MKLFLARTALILVAAAIIILPNTHAQGEELSALEGGKGDYVVGLEDVLRVVVWGEPELSSSLTVRPDGKITLPLVNDIYVLGQTPAQIRTRLTEALSQFVREPSVTVVVEKINSFRVFFVGEVGAKGAIPFLRPTRVLQAIATAGGPGEFAKNQIILVREVDGVEQRIKIDYKKLVNGDEEQENFFVRPNDMLIFN